MKAFEGVITALITPFSPSGKGLDEKVLRALIERQVEAGVDAVILAGSTGEGQTLTDEERTTLFRIGASYTKSLSILGGAGHSSTEKAIEQARAIEQAGLSGVLLASPAYNRPTQAGLLDYFQSVAASIKLPIMAYNIPPRAAVNILPDTARELWKIPNLVSYKESSGNWDQILQLASETPSSKTLLSGDDPMNLGFWVLGARGTVSVLSNLSPKALVAQWKAWKERDLESARRIQFQVQQITKLLFVESNPIPTKFAVGYALNLAELTPRRPLLPLSAGFHQDLKKAVDALREFGFL